MEGYERDYSLWINQKDKTESYLIKNYFVENGYKKGDTIVYNQHFKSISVELYIHQELELVAEFDEDDIVWAKNLNYFHNGIVSHETFYFDKPNHHGDVIMLKNGLFVLITYKDRQRIHNGQVFADKDELKNAIEELMQE